MFKDNTSFNCEAAVRQHQSLEKKVQDRHIKGCTYGNLRRINSRTQFSTLFTEEQKKALTQLETSQSGVLVQSPGQEDSTSGD